MLSLLTFAAKKDRDWKIGKLVDSSLNGKQYVLNIPLDINNLVIHGGDYLYTARQVMGRRSSCRLIVGDDIKYAQDKRALYVVDADGKECKLEIVRQERWN
jgi:hypothetical protein